MALPCGNDLVGYWRTRSQVEQAGIGHRAASAWPWPAMYLDSEFINSEAPTSTGRNIHGEVSVLVHQIDQAALAAQPAHPGQVGDLGAGVGDVSR